MSDKKLNKKTVDKAYWIWQLFSHANYNYERMQGGAFAASMTPVIDELYGDNHEEKVAALKRHLTFFNTNPNFGTIIHGAAIAMEEERANGAKEINDEAINAVKTGLMGPLAGIGDALDQGVLMPLIVALGISLAIQGNVLGSILVMILNPLACILIARYFWYMGYNLGGNAVTQVLADGKMKSLISAASILGCTVMGALISQYVSLSTPLTFAIGQSEFNLQSQIFDAIMPNILPLALTLLIYWLLGKEKWNTTKILILLLVVGLVCGFIGIF